MCFGFDILIYGCALQLHSCNLIFDKDVFYFSITLLHPVFMSKKMKATRWSRHKRTNVCMFWIKTMIKYFMLSFHKQLSMGTCGGGVDSSFWAIWSLKKNNSRLLFIQKLDQPMKFTSQPLDHGDFTEEGRGCRINPQTVEQPLCLPGPKSAPWVNFTPEQSSAEVAKPFPAQLIVDCRHQPFPLSVTRWLCIPRKSSSIPA